MLDNLSFTAMKLSEIDSALFFLINKNLQSSFLDVVMPFVTKHAELVFLGPVLWAAIKEKKAILQFLLISLFAVALADGSGHILKDIIQRQRPCNIFSDINLLVGCGHSYSMPSGHASNAFAFAMTFFILRKNIIGYLSLAAAAIIALSRVYVGVHYPSDILAGALLGAGAAYSAIQLYRWGSRIYEKRSYGEALVFFLFLISLFRVYFILTSPFDLSPDEAHYWEWSRRLDWSYYSKGPMIAYLIYLGTSVFGNTVFGVRVLAVVLSAASSCLIYLMARDLYDEKTGLVSALLVQTVPLYSVFGVLFTIDSPFIFFWVLSLYIFHKLLQRQLPKEFIIKAPSPLPTGQAGPPSREGDKGEGYVCAFTNDHMSKTRFDYYWVLLGISVGLGLLTKYTMAFFLFSGFLFLLSSKDTRDLLKTSGPYIAVFVSLAVFSPVILWNAANGWVTLKHTAGQAHVAEGLKISAMDFIEFTGSQFGVITPVLLVLIITALWKIRKTQKGAFLFWFSAPTVIFFVLKSLQGKVEANWALPGYAAGFIAFSAYYARDLMTSGRSRKVLLISAILLSLLVTLFAHFPSMLHLPQKMDPTSRLIGWKELGEEASLVYREMTGPAPVFIFATRYQVSSELAFYMDGHPVTYCANIDRRMNQYDLWPGLEGLKGHNAVYVRMSSNLPKEVGVAFERCEKQPVAIRTKQNKKVKFTIFKCYDFKGMKMRQTKSY